MTGWESPDPAARITPPDPAPTSPEPTAAAEACAALLPASTDARAPARLGAGPANAGLRNK